MSTKLGYKSFDDLVEERAANLSSEVAYVFLRDGEDEEEKISFGELRDRALAIAAVLKGCSQPGDRALLLYAPGLEYIVAFLGCLYAGVIAVPAYPPSGRRGLPRLESVAIDAAPKFAMFDRATRRRIDGMRVKPAFLESLETFITDEISSVSDVFENDRTEVFADDVAFLQYTSGSTGSPKGVVLTHANLLNNQRMISKAFAHSDSTRVCSWLPPYHDMGLIGTILQPLYLGVPSILMPPQAFLQKPVRWLAAISRFRATTSGAPNFAYDLCVDKIDAGSMEGLDLSCWNLAFNGAEPVRPETMDAFARKFAPYGFNRSAFFPCYGLAEATLLVAGGEKLAEPHYEAFSKTAIEENRVRIGASKKETKQVLASCGMPVEQELRIVDPDTLIPCEEGTIGEIWVSGENVAKGYWRKPNLTSDTFHARLKDEDSEEFTERSWLRTGDLGFSDRGEIFITGRLKDLIIVRGRNHYPSDLEQTAKKAHRSLLRGNSAAFSVEVEGEERLVLVQEIDRGQLSAAAEATRAISESIAMSHELSFHELLIVRPGTVPLTSSGKIQRNYCRQLYLEGKLDALPAGSHEGNTLPTQVGRFPASPTEKQVARIWSEELRLDRVFANDNFFQLGGDSLAGTQVAFSLNEAFGVELPSEILHENQTVSSLALAIDEVIAAKENEAEYPEDAESTTVQSVLRSPRHAIGRKSECRFPLSHQQRRVWFLSKLNPSSSDYHVPVALCLQGNLNPEALEKQLQAVLARYDILRAVIEELDGEPFMRILEAPQISFEYCDLSRLDEEQLSVDCKRCKAEVSSSPFNLSEGPLWRAQLLKTGDEEYRFLLTTHHLISDGWSIVRWVHEIFDTLEKGTARPELSGRSSQSWSYGEYIEWQRGQAAKKAYRARLNWWTSLLKDSQPLRLPRDIAVTVDSKSDLPVCSATLPCEQLLQIKQLASENETTLFVVLLTVFKILLKRHSGQDSINVGYPAANRTHPYSQDALGFYVNTLVARTIFSIEGSSFVEALEDTKRVVSGGLARQDVSFDDVLRELQLGGSGGRNVLFQVFFNLLSLPINEGVKEDAARQLKVDLAEEPVWGNKFDFSLYARECEAGLRLNLLFDSTLFSVARVREMLNQYFLLLGQIVSDPRRAIGAYSLVTDQARQLLADSDELAESSGGFHPPYMLFEEQAQRCPHAVAVVSGDEEWTYRQLDEQANRIAHALLQKGIDAEEVVAIWAERSEWLVCSLLGVHKAGAAFAIFDPSHPAARLQQCIEVAKPKLMLSLGDLANIPQEIVAYALERDLEVLDIRKCASGLQDEERFSVSSCDLDRKVDVDDLAYLAFTSGTTGSPLCIEGTHAPLSHFLYWYAGELSLADTASPFGFSMLSGLAHDPLLRDIFAPLVTGNTLCIPSQGLFNRPSRLVSWLSDSGIEVAHLTPALWELIASAATDELRFDSLKFAVFSGEVLLVDHLRSLRKLAPNAIVINGYGATETPQLATFKRVESCEPCSPARSEAIGMRGGDNRIVLINTEGEQAAPGELAEICVQSAFLARGYRTLEGVEPIGEKLGFEVSENVRTYGTGDLGRYDLRGDIYFEKRKNRQVSIHGFRVELSEIELAIQGHPQVTRCAVLFLPNKAKRGSLVAYYASSQALEESDLVAYLTDLLPGHMLPARCVCLESFPLNPNGKTDYAVLRMYKVEELAPTSRFEPQSEAEAKLVAICSRILKIPEVDLEQSYSRLGGSSIDAVKVSMEIESEFGIQPSLTFFFQGRTLSSLAAWVENEVWLRREGGHERAASQSDECSGRETIVL